MDTATTRNGTQCHTAFLGGAGGTTKDRSTYSRASNLKGQKHAERNLLLFLEKSSMTLTQERTVIHLLLKKDQLRSSEGTMLCSPIKITLACTKRGSELLC